MRLLILCILLTVNGLSQSNDKGKIILYSKMMSPYLEAEIIGKDTTFSLFCMRAERKLEGEACVLIFNTKTEILNFFLLCKEVISMNEKREFSSNLFVSMYNKKAVRIEGNEIYFLLNSKQIESMSQAIEKQF